MSKKKKGAIAGVAAAVVIVCAAGAGNAGALQQIQNQSVWNTAGNVYTVPGNSGYVSGDDARVQRGNRFLPGNQPG